MSTRASIIVSEVAIAAGVLMIVFKASVGSREVVLAGGILLLLAGLTNILINCLSAKRAEDEADDADGRRYVYADRSHKVRRGFVFWLTMVVSIAAAVFGIVVISSPMSWTAYIPVIFGFVALVAAVVLFYQLAVASRPAPLPSWLYIPATLVAIAAVVDFFLETPAQDSAMMCVTGIAFCLFGGSMLAVYLSVNAYRKACEALEDAEPQTKTLDAVSEAKEPVALDDENSNV